MFILKRCASMSRRGLFPRSVRVEILACLTSEGINLAGVIRILDLKGRLDERDDEIDSLHKRVRRLADRVHELETRESVNSLVNETNSIVLRRFT